MPFRIRETPDALEVTDTPTALRALGAAFVCSGLAVLAVPLVSTSWRAFSLLERLAVLAIGAGHLAGGAWTVRQPIATRLRIDRRTMDGVHVTRRAFSRHGTVTRFRAADARRLELVQGKDDDGDATFTLRLWLADSVVLPLQGQPSYGRPQAEARLRALGRQLGVPTVPA